MRQSRRRMQSEIASLRRVVEVDREVRDHDNSLYVRLLQRLDAVYAKHVPTITGQQLGLSALPTLWCDGCRRQWPCEVWHDLRAATGDARRFRLAFDEIKGDDT